MTRRAAGRRRPFGRRRVARLVGLALLALSILLLAPELAGGGTELVRIRHALTLGPDMTEADDWRPPHRPAGYRFEGRVEEARLVEVVRRLDLGRLGDDWARAQAIGRHLLTSAPRLVGGPVQADLWGTHQAIVTRGEGYCGDFVRVFQAMANAAGLTVRPWAFSFDGFGGHGHIWVELWNRDLQRWQLIDIFDNFYFVRRGANEPVTALELRRALLDARGASGGGLELRRFVPEARPGYVVEEKAWAYFARGKDQWYMPWGNNVAEVESALTVRMFSNWSRIGEGLGALASGRMPVVRMLASEVNADARARMRQTRLRVQTALAAGTVGLLLLILAPWIGPATRRQSTGRDEGRSTSWPRLCVVGPLPPPSGGMANQCEQLVRLLRSDGADVTLVRTNAPYRPAWIGRVPFVRAGFRLLPYLWALWRGVGRAHVVHVFANSGWAWHLLAAPALHVARLRGVPAIVNYRGGQADEFFSSAPGHVLRALRGAALRVTPSAFLLRVFAKHGLDAEIVPNIIDLARFKARPQRVFAGDPHIVVTRNLEPIYDIPTAIRAFARVRERHSGAKLAIAGSGPELERLREIVAELNLSDAVRFSGRIDNARIGQLYEWADVMLNPSTADNMPISILEAMACGVPVVTTNAGGIPDLVQDGRTALIVPVGDAAALAEAVLRVLEDPALARRLHEAGLREASRYAWPRVRERWLDAYRRLADGDAPASIEHSSSPNPNR